MPRIHQNETQHLNVFCALFNGLREVDGWNGIPSDLAHSGYVRLFDNQYIGMRELTNLQVPGQLACDQTAWILNWYARTNIPACSQLDDWAHSAIATLSVGCHPILELTLFDLLKRSNMLERDAVQLPLELLPDGKAVNANNDSLLGGIARQALEAHQRSLGQRQAFFDLPADEQRAWLDVAHDMWKLLKGPPVVVVPTRQNFDVRISGSVAAIEALRSHVLAIGEGDVAPQFRNIAPIQPRARMWVHLEGFSFYDRW